MFKMWSHIIVPLYDMVSFSYSHKISAKVFQVTNKTYALPKNIPAGENK